MSDDREEKPARQICPDCGQDTSYDDHDTACAAWQQQQEEE